MATKAAPKNKPLGKDDPAVQQADDLNALDLGAGDGVAWMDKPVDDLSEPRRWIIGKPPEDGGKETEYSVYVQQPLGWMAQQRFFSLCSSAMSRAIRASGGEVAGMSDIFGNEGGTIRQRGEKLMARDWQDASTFAALAFELSAYVPDLMLEFYCIWLQVPTGEKIWAKAMFEQPRDPDRNKWGPTNDEHRMIIGTFIDQNYKGLREFFTVDLPAIARRVVSNEKARQDLESGSDPSKPLNSSGQEAVTS